MAEQNKTQPTAADAEEFLNAIDDQGKRTDCLAIMALMRRLTTSISGSPAQPTMWGPSIVGFGRYRYVYDSGRSGEFFYTGFSPRKQNITLYVVAGFERYEELLGRLGKHKTGKSCLYIKRLADVDLAVLEELIARSVEHMAATNPPA